MSDFIDDLKYLMDEDYLSTSDKHILHVAIGRFDELDTANARRLELLRRLEFATNDDGQTVAWMWLQKDELEKLAKELADAHGRL
jgi:hypothetical protein